VQKVYQEQKEHRFSKRKGDVLADLETEVAHDIVVIPLA